MSFGDVKIYTTPLSVPLPLVTYQSRSKVIVLYQGCAKAGFCYQPETRVIDITPFNAESIRVIEPKTNTATQTTLPQTDNAPRLHKIHWPTNWGKIGGRHCCFSA